jgi:predicted dehydrogenase
MDGVSLALVASGNPNTAALVSGTPVVTNWHDLLVADLDGVLIATPPAYHGEMLRALVAARIPVMVEKPLCLDLTEACELRALVVTSGALVLVDHTQLFHPAYIMLKTRAENLGRVRFTRSEGMAFGPFRRDVPVLWDWTPHDVSLCLDLLGIVPEQVVAIGDRTSVTLWLAFDGGASAWIANSNLSPEKRRTLTVHFDHHVLVLNDFATNKLVEYEIDFMPGCDYPPSRGSGIPLPVPEGRPLTRAVAHFVQGIMGGDLTGFGLNFACDVVRIIDAAQRSMEDTQLKSLAPLS